MDLPAAKTACATAITHAQQVHREWQGRPADRALLERLVDARRQEVATADQVLDVAAQRHVDAGAIAQLRQLRSRLAQHLVDAEAELARLNP